MAETHSRSRNRHTSRSPGRPEGSSDTRDEILDAAEESFSSLGFAGTTLQKIADRAQVTQALVTYYFGPKKDLYEQVFLRRSLAIAQERIRRLEALEARGDVSARDLVQAFLAPIQSLRTTAQGRAFLRLQARLHTEPPEISYTLRRKAYGESTALYAEAFRKVLTHLKPLDVYWRVTMMVGTYLYAFSDTHRMEELAQDVGYDKDDTESLIDGVVRFLAGGFEAE